MTRQAAFELLRSSSDAPLRDVDRIASRYGFDDRDRGLIRALVGTEIRRRGSLRAIVNAFVPRKPKPELITLIHIGLVQLLYLDKIPDHAAVSETSDAVSRTVGQSKVPFVHGVLRNVLRAREEGSSGDPTRDLVGRDVHLNKSVFRDPVKHPLLWAEDALSMPAPLMKRWTRRYRAEPAEALARFFLEEPPLVLRAVADRDAILAELRERDVDARPGKRETTIVAPASATGAVTSCDAFRAGKLTVQGEHAALAGSFLEAQPGERLVDLCAAPGGKTAILAASGAEVTAVDIDERRLDLARDTCERMGVLDRVTFRVGDGTDLSDTFSASDEGAYDGLLIDAPCSNTGVLGARPEARWRFGPGSLDSVTSLQARLLDEGSRLVRPGGRLVWSTCSLEPEENARRVAAFLDTHPDWKLEADRSSVPSHDGPWDGGYVARLRRG